MKIINRHLVQQHEERVAVFTAQYKAHLAEIQAAAPQPIEVVQVQEGETSKTLKDGDVEIVVMPGDYYHEDADGTFGIAAAEIGDNGAWAVVADRDLAERKGA